MNYAKKFVFNHDLKHILSVISYRLKKQVKPFPSIIHIQTINWCNASCKMCPNSQNKNRFVEIMPDDLFEKIVLEIEREAKSYTMVLLYLQNEPLTDDFFLKRMQFFKNHKNKHMSIGFLTNGSLLNDNIISK